MATADLTASQVRELLDYDAESGVFTRKVRTSRRINVGDVAGTLRPDGYLKISLFNKSHLAHRLAWLHVYGAWPEYQVDHVNGVRTDNRIANLRDLAPLHNQQNQRRAHSRNKSSRLLGVTWHRGNKKWQAQIAINKRQTYIGQFDTPEAAHEAYLAAKRALHEGCTI